MLFIILPAYNEEEGLERLLDRIKRITASLEFDYQLVIINDGSQDHTVDVIQSYANGMSIHLVNFQHNRGLTEVIRTGFQWVCERGQDDDICITLDADNTHNPYVMLDIIRKCEEGYDIVIASRFQDGGGMVGVPVTRRVLSLGVAWLLRTFFPIPGVRDFSTFFRGHRVGVLKSAFETYGEDLLRGEGFAGMAWYLYKLSTLTDKITEVPLILRFDLKEGGSKMRIVRTVIGYVGLMASLRRRTR